MRKVSALALLLGVLALAPAVVFADCSSGHSTKTSSTTTTDQTTTDGSVAEKPADRK